MATTLEGKRKDVIGMNPFDPKLVIAGRDKPLENVGPEHPRYDPRARRAATQETVDSMKRVGMLEPISVAPEKIDGEIYYVIVFGRGRLINAREAWLQEEAAGVPEDERVKVMVLAPLTANGGWSLDDLEDAAIIENNHRDNDPLAVRAERIAMYVGKRVKRGNKTESQAIADACIAFRLKASAIKECLRVNGASDELKTANLKGEIGDTVLMRLSSLEPAEQPQALEELKAKGDLTADDARAHVTTVNQRRKVTKAAGGKKPDDDGEVKVAPPRSTLRKLHERIKAKESDLHPQAQAMLRFVLGELSARGVDGLGGELKAIAPAPRDAE